MTDRRRFIRRMATRAVTMPNQFRLAMMRRDFNRARYEAQHKGSDWAR